MSSSRRGRPATVPSRTHETRRVLLETIADAAGYRLEMCLPDGTRPDVLRLHVGRLSLFLGEAKHTEGPSDFNSTDRLCHYLDWLVPLCQRGAGSVLAIAHPCGLGCDWQDRLGWLCQDLRIKGVVGSTSVTPVTTVTFVAFGAGGWRHDPPGKARTRYSRHSAA